MEVKIFGQTLKIYTEHLSKTKKTKHLEKQNKSNGEHYVWESSIFSGFFPTLAQNHTETGQNLYFFFYLQERQTMVILTSLRGCTVGLCIKM